MINVVFFFVFWILFGVMALAGFTVHEAVGVLCEFGAFVLALVSCTMVRIARQWERCLILRLGNFNGLKGPGLFFVIPVVDEVIAVDTRTITADIPKQQVITQDNVPVEINGVLYFHVENPEVAITKVQNFGYAIGQYAQTALRDVVGGMSLDQLLSERARISEEIEKIVEKAASGWGVRVTNIKLQDIDMPEDLKKMMSRQASAEREKRATITKAEGDKLAAVNLAHAAKTMAESPGAMQLRTLQTIDGLGPTPSNTVILAIPIDVLELARKYAKPAPEVAAVAAAPETASS
ncbi:MAG: slipin family protein [Planctomycetes bacterium]|nr:slipin family protein [Planctomycetota bacterium]